MALLAQQASEEALAGYRCGLGRLTAVAAVGGRNALECLFNVLATAGPGGLVAGVAENFLAHTYFLLVRGSSRTPAAPYI